MEEIIDGQWNHSEGIESWHKEPDNTLNCMKMQGSDVQQGPQCGSLKSQHHILAVPKGNLSG